MRRRDNDTIADTTTNRINIRKAIATSGGTTARMVFASGMAGPDQTTVSAALGLTLAVVRYRIRKSF